MSNAIIVRPLPVASISAPTGTSAGDAAHVALEPAADYMGLFWQATGIAGALVVDMGADVTVDTVALLNMSDAGTGTWFFQWATAAQGSGFTPGNYSESFTAPAPDLNAGANPLANGQQAALYLADANAPMVGRYFKILCGWSTGTFQFSRLVMGRRFTPTRNFSFGAAFGVRSFGSVTYSDRATLLRRRGRRLRVVGLSFSNLYRDEVEANVHPLIELAADDSPLLLVTDPAENANRTSRIYFGHLEGDLGTIWRNARAWEFKANLVSLF